MKIAEFLKGAFDPKLTEMVNSIVTGVLDGLRDKVTKLEKENKDLRERVEKLEAKADVAEQYSRRNCTVSELQAGQNILTELKYATHNISICTYVFDVLIKSFYEMTF